MSINIKELPSVTVATKRLLPKEPGVYFVLQDEVLVYIGQTDNLKRRWSGHPLLKQLDSENRIHWLSVEVGLLLSVEKRYINELTPLFNIKRRRKQPLDRLGKRGPKANPDLEPNFTTAFSAREDCMKRLERLRASGRYGKTRGEVICRALELLEQSEPT